MTDALRDYLILESAMLLLDDSDPTLAEALRDVMDKRWHALSDDDRARLNGRGRLVGRSVRHRACQGSGCEGCLWDGNVWEGDG